MNRRGFVKEPVDAGRGEGSQVAEEAVCLVQGSGPKTRTPMHLPALKESAGKI
jgi:hypothetical protein